MEEKIRLYIGISWFFVGLAKSGKSALIRQFSGYPFEAHYRKTVGRMDYYVKHYTDSQGKHYSISLFEICGIEDCFALTPSIAEYLTLDHSEPEALVIVLDGSQDEALAFQLNQWLDVVLKQPSQVPIYFFINKLDLIEEVDRPDRIFSIREILSRVLRERKLTQNVIRARGFSVYFCSAKTGEGVSAAFDALFENSQHNASTPDDVVDKTHLSEPESTDAKHTSPFRLTLFSRGIRNRYNKIKGLFIQHKPWMGGNLLILTATLAVITVTLLFSVGSVFMPAWALTLLLGNILLSLWYIGWRLYQRSQKDRENALQMSNDESSCESIGIKENRETWLEPQPPLLPRPQGFRTPSASSSPSISDDEQDNSNLQNSTRILL